MKPGSGARFMVPMADDKRAVKPNCRWVEVIGLVVKMPHPTAGAFAVHAGPEDGGFAVAHVETGFAVTVGAKTIDEAIAEAQFKMAMQPAEKIADAIMRASHFMKTGERLVGADGNQS